MTKNFQAETYIVDEQVADTVAWLLHHQDCFDELHFDVRNQHKNPFLRWASLCKSIAKQGNPLQSMTLDITR